MFSHRISFSFKVHLIFLPPRIGADRTVACTTPIREVKIRWKVDAKNTRGLRFHLLGNSNAHSKIASLTSHPPLPNGTFFFESSYPHTTLSPLSLSLSPLQHELLHFDPADAVVGANLLEALASYGRLPGLDGVPSSSPSSSDLGVLVTSAGGCLHIALGGNAVPADVVRGNSFVPMPLRAGGTAYNVHGGCLRHARDAYDVLTSFCRRGPPGVTSLTISGHSVFGGAAVLLSLLLHTQNPFGVVPINVTTFGAPKIWCCRQWEARDMLAGIAVHRCFVNGYDIVPRVLGSGAARASAQVFTRLGFDVAGVPQRAWQHAERFVAYGCPLLLLNGSSSTEITSHIEQLHTLSAQLKHIGASSIADHSIVAYVTSLTAAAGCKAVVQRRYAVERPVEMVDLEVREELGRFRERRAAAEGLDVEVEAGMGQMHPVGEAGVNAKLAADAGLQERRMQLWRDGVLDASEVVAQTGRLAAAHCIACRDVGMNSDVALQLLRATIVALKQAERDFPFYGAVLRHHVALAYNNKACVYRRLGSHVNALADLKRAVQTAPGTETYANLSAVYLAAGARRDALSAALAAAEHLKLSHEYVFLADLTRRAAQLFPVNTEVQTASGETGRVVGHARGRVGVLLETDERVGCLPVHLRRTAASFVVGEEVRVDGAAAVVSGVARGRVGVKVGGSQASRGVKPGDVVVPCAQLAKAVTAVVCLHNLLLAAHQLPVTPKERSAVHDAGQRLAELLAWLGPHPVAARMRTTLSLLQPTPKPTPLLAPLQTRHISTAPAGAKTLLLPPIETRARTPQTAMLMLPPPPLVKGQNGGWKVAKVPRRASPAVLQKRERGWSCRIGPDDEGDSGAVELAPLTSLGGPTGREALLVEKVIYRETTKRKALLKGEAAARVAFKFREVRGKGHSLEVAGRHNLVVGEARAFRALQCEQESRGALIAGQLRLLAAVDDMSDALSLEEDTAALRLHHAATLLRCTTDEWLCRSALQKLRRRDSDALERDFEQTTQALHLLSNIGVRERQRSAA